MESISLAKDYANEKRDRKRNRYARYVDPVDGLMTVEIPKEDYFKFPIFIREGQYGLRPTKIKLV